MPSTSVHEFDAAWAPSDPAHLESAVSDFSVSGASALRLTSEGAAGVEAEYVPPQPMDLSTSDEIRFWTYADRYADGSARFPFLMEIGYTDAGDEPGEEHRWLIPFIRAGRVRSWEQHRIGIAGDRRSAIDRWFIRFRTDRPVRVFVDDLLAVAEQPLADVELRLAELFAPFAPVVTEESPLSPPAEAADLDDPVILLALTDQREEPERGWNIKQRDSFRAREGLTVCSVRPPARPVLLEYQVIPTASSRAQSLALRTEVLRRVGVDSGLRVNGTVLPVQTLLPPPLDVRDRGILAPVYLHVGTRIEQGDRVEIPWVQSASVLSGPLGAPGDPTPPSPLDTEGIVLRL